MKKTILIAAVMFFAFTVAASAQALFQVGSTPVIEVASCGTTELTGDIAFTQVAGSPPIQTGTITINYGVPITALLKADLTAANVTIINSLGTVVGTIPLSNALGGNVSGSLLTFTVGPGQISDFNTNPPYTYKVSGVRVNVAGNSSLTSLSASVSSTVNLFVGGQTTVEVISSIGSAIGSIDTSQGGPGSTSALFINAVSLVGLGTVTIDVNEGFASAFVPGQIIGLTFSTIPVGLSLNSFPLTITDTQGTVFTLVDSGNAAAAASTSSPVLTSASTNLNVYYKVTTLGANAVAEVETLRIPVTVTTTTNPPAPSPLPQGTVTVTVDVYPKLGAFPDRAGSTVPQYSGTTCQKGPITIVTVLTANTALLIPFATTAGSFDTGIAIANTTKDPFIAGQSAIPQDGSITFFFFPQTGASFQYPAANGTITVGGGLTGGVLKAGGLYSVLLTELLTAASGPADFSGYIIAVCNFTNGHGNYFISDFESFTNGSLMLVLDPAAQRKNAPEKLDN